MVDLPQPLSPTRATVCRERERPSEFNCLLVTDGSIGTDDCSKIEGRNVRCFSYLPGWYSQVEISEYLNIRAGWI
jgi:hypothetical protein